MEYTYNGIRVESNKPLNSTLFRPVEEKPTASKTEEKPKRTRTTKK